MRIPLVVVVVVLGTLCLTVQSALYMGVTKEDVDKMTRSLQVDSDFSGMLLYQFPAEVIADDEIIESLAQILNLLRDEIATLRLVRETFKKSPEARYWRLTAADTLAVVAKKLAESGLDRRISLRIMHAVQMYAQPEIKNPFEEGESRFDSRRKKEIERLQRKAREILNRLQELSIY